MKGDQRWAEKKLKMTRDFFGKAGKTIVMKNKTSLRNGSGSMSADITSIKPAKSKQRLRASASRNAISAKRKEVR